MILSGFDDGLTWELGLTSFGKVFDDLVCLAAVFWLDESAFFVESLFTFVFLVGLGFSFVLEIWAPTLTVS